MFEGPKTSSQLAKNQPGFLGKLMIIKWVNRVKIPRRHGKDYL